MTDAEHGAAQPDLEATDARLGEHRGAAAGRGRRAGRRRLRRAPPPSGLTTTLGRGGSDYSAALFGAGLGAEEIQIWTDVDGMLTADPRMIPGSRVVPHISFDEASELAYFGAKVLHPSTILPAVRRDIPVRILNSHRPEAPGTRITRSPAEGGAGPVAIACKRGLTRLDIASTRMLMAYGFLRRVFEVFERYRTPVDVVTTSEVSVSVTIDDRRALDAIVADLSEFAEVSSEEGMAIVCAVGEGLRRDASLATRVLGALEGLPLVMVSQGGSRQNITVVVRDGDVARAMEQLHRRFFEDAGGRGARLRRAMRLLIVGHGRMGRLVEELAPDYGFEVAGVLEIDSNADGSGVTAGALPGRRRGRRLLDRRGDAGHRAAAGRGGGQPRGGHHRLAGPRGRDARGGGGAPGWERWWPPTSRSGANLMNALAGRDGPAARRTRTAYGAWIHEAHHKAKMDAPSGTALMLKRALEEAGYGLPVDVSSTRAGWIPGTHSVGFDGPAEGLTLTHTVRDRATFAHGALEAARWVKGRKGWFTMRDVLGLGD